MGVNCHVKLNEGADWRKVGQVACALLGAPMKREPLGTDGWHIVVDGFGYGKYHAWDKQPAYIDILVTGYEDNPLVLKIKESDGMPYHFSYNMEGRSLFPAATAAKIALCEAITKFFGGMIEYNDCKGRTRKFLSPHKFAGEGNPAFYRFQKALEAIKPLTQEDIDRCAKHAAY